MLFLGIHWRVIRNQLLSLHVIPTPLIVAQLTVDTLINPEAEPSPPITNEEPKSVGVES